jgi:hypothetical protein
VSRAELNDGVWRLSEVFESDENGIKLNGAVASGNKSNEIKAPGRRTKTPLGGAVVISIKTRIDRWTYI